VAAPPSSVAPAAPAMTAAPSANAAAPAPPNPRPSFHSLFSDNQGQPVPQFVRDLWTTNPRVAAALTGQGAPATESATARAPASPAGAPLDLFSDRPSDVRSLFGDRQ